MSPLEMQTEVLPQTSVTAYLHNIAPEFKLLPLFGIDKLVLTRRSEVEIPLAISRDAALHYRNIAYHSVGPCAVELPLSHTLSKLELFAHKENAQQNILRLHLYVKNASSSLPGLTLDLLAPSDSEEISIVGDGYGAVGNADSILRSLRTFLQLDLHEPD